MQLFESYAQRREKNVSHNVQSQDKLLPRTVHKMLLNMFIGKCNVRSYGEIKYLQFNH